MAMRARLVQLLEKPSAGTPNIGPLTAEEAITASTKPKAERAIKARDIFLIVISNFGLSVSEDYHTRSFYRIEKKILPQNPYFYLP